MPQLEDLPIDLALFDSVKHGSAPLGSVKTQLGETWRRSIRSLGGYWTATADYEAEDFQKLDMFQDKLGLEIRETLGGYITWQGFLARMELVKDGYTFIRQWADMANRVQVIYTRLGDNLLTNGSVETGNWTAYGAPTTLLQSSTWIADGNVSEHIIGAAGDGATIQTGIVIVAGKAYDAQLSANLIAGTWRLEVYRTDTGARLAATDEPAAGQKVMRTTVPDTNTYAGAIGVRFYCTAGPGVGSAEAYADGATFREASQQARTSWIADTISQAEYGTLENAVLLAGMSDAAANAYAATYLAKQAWPRTLAPGDYGAGHEAGQPMRLTLTFYGYAFTLRNKYTSRAGTTQAASTHVANHVADSEFITAGVIETNATQYQVEDRAPLRAWEVIRDVARAGDASGARWNAGVYANRLFEFAPASTTPEYHYKGGSVLNPAGGALEPWFVLPGMVYLDDMPVGTGSPTALPADDPHVMYIEAVEFNAADWLRGEPGLTFQREAGSDAL